VCSESNVPSVLTEKHHRCSDQQSEQWLAQNALLVSVLFKILLKDECPNPVPEIICNKNSDANQLLNAGCLKQILLKRRNDVNIPPSPPAEVHFCWSLGWLPIDPMRESASVEAARVRKLTMPLASYKNWA